MVSIGEFMCEIEKTLIYWLNYGIIAEDWSSDFIEPSEIEIFQHSVELNCLNELIKKTEELWILENLFEIATNINYIPVQQNLITHLGQIACNLNHIIDNKNNYDYFVVSFSKFLIKLNNKKGMDFLTENFHKLSEKNQAEICFDLDQKIKNRTALKTLLILYNMLSNSNKYYDTKYKNSNILVLKDHLTNLNKLKKQCDSGTIFSIEIQMTYYEKIDKDNIFNKLKKILNKKNMWIIFRSSDENIGAFLEERTSLNFDLFTNKNITAKEIAELFGNKSILYLSGETEIDGKKIFYENAAWYKTNENMPIQDKIFWNEPRIAKFRVYNVINND